ncbi:MAG: putative membrane protein, partial [Hyphomicrobiaceae bacterium]
RIANSPTTSVKRAANAAATWRRYRLQRGRWNAVRTVMLALATTDFVLARRETILQHTPDPPTPTLG